MTSSLFDADELAALVDGAGDKGSLFDRYTVPPFSVLDARQGYWKDRKKAWLRHGIQSELGRADEGVGECFGAIDNDRFTGFEGLNQTSVFDPVLCELAYRWFARPGSRVLDPFAGGSVRGVVAGLLGLDYTGVELRPEQVAANRRQAEALCPDRRIRWIEGDSAAAVPDLAGAFDLVFSCPPYGDLEVYSDHPADLSNMSPRAFAEAYGGIIRASVDRLALDRFACFVVGDYRRKDGTMEDFAGATIRAFEAAGCALYNKAVLLQPVASLAVRAAKQMDVSRKIGKMHQDVLVFVKGDARAATAWLGGVTVGPVPPRALGHTSPSHSGMSSMERRQQGQTTS